MHTTLTPSTLCRVGKILIMSIPIITNYILKDRNKHVAFAKQGQLSKIAGPANANVRMWTSSSIVKKGLKTTKHKSNRTTQTSHYTVFLENLNIFRQFTIQIVVNRNQDAEFHQIPVLLVAFTALSTLFLPMSATIFFPLWWSRSQLMSIFLQTKRLSFSCIISTWT